VLSRDNKPLTYGNGVPAPWNANPPADANNPSGAGAKKDGQVNGVAPKEAATSAVLPDARLYATWDYEQKYYWVPLGNTIRGRAAARGNTSASGSSKTASGSGAGTISLNVRGRSASKAG